MNTSMPGIPPLQSSTPHSPAPVRNPALVRPRDDVAGNNNQQPRSDIENRGSLDDVHASVVAMSDFVRQFNSDLKFSIDQDTGKTVVKVVDQATDEVIRQIPGEEVLAIAKALDKLKGLLIHQKA